MRGRVQAVSSKSAGHRAIIAAALSEKPVDIHINCISQDIEATCRCISALGGAAEKIDGGLRIHPVAPCGEALLDCGESGSTARFLLPVAMALCDKVNITGAGRLPERPFAPLCGTMEENGCVFDGDLIPMNVNGRLKAGVFRIDGNVSSQFVSGLLFALPLLDGDSRIVLTSPPESAGYIDMTLATIKSFGIKVNVRDDGYEIPGNQKYIAKSDVIIVEGDWSNAAFWLAAGALGGDITVCGLDMDSLQRDKQIVSVLERMGARISVSGNEVRSKKRCLNAVNINAQDIPDIVPILAATASGAEGITSITGAGRLRIKECDRLSAVSELITALGGSCLCADTGLVIKGTHRLSGGNVDGCGDHRIVMTAAVISSICNRKVVINGSEAVSKSYPTFFDDFCSLGGIVTF